MNHMRTSFLKEMGITEWVSRDAVDVSSTVAPVTTDYDSAIQAGEAPPRARWWFFGVKPQGDAQRLFQNVIRVLGLSSQEWSWKLPEDLSCLSLPEDDMPVLAFTFGSQAVQKITGERDPLPQLRGTILALNIGDDEIPVVASEDLTRLISNPKEKALFWQDLLLAKSILQNS